MNRQLCTDKPAKQLQLKLLLNKGHQDRQFDDPLLCPRLCLYVDSYKPQNSIHSFIPSFIHSTKIYLVLTLCQPLHEDEAFLLMELTL